MRRDYFTLGVTDLDEGLPTLRVDLEGPVDEFADRLHDEDGPLPARAIDVGYRLLDPLEDDEAMGVLGVTNRVTGEFILELNAAAEDVLEFVRAARARQEDDARYRLRIVHDGDELAGYEKSTFLVYEPDGDLLRQHSLIPSGVEL
jgi:hypothetical protein